MTKVPDPNLKKCKYNVLVAWETGEKIYELLSVQEIDAPVTFVIYDGKKRYRSLGKRDKHDLSSPASPKGDMKSSLSWTSPFKSPTSSTLCFGEPTLGKLNQVKLLCSLTLALYMTLHLPSSIKKQSFVSPSTFLIVTLLLILELHSLCQVLLLKQTEFPTDTPD